MTTHLPPVAEDASVVVVGGANTDIVAVPSGPLIAADSNPGTVRIGAGGVGRNIAENLARLGVRTSLVTAFGDDDASALLRTWCEQAGIDTSLSVIARDMPGARYLAINDDAHDLAVAVNDMRVLGRITPETLGDRARRAALKEASLVVLDTNVSAETIAWLAAETSAPLLADPVSVAKARRVAPVLSRLAAIKPNRQEAAALLGHPVEGIECVEAAARELVALGVGRAFVTAGPLGSAWADAQGSGVLRDEAVEIVNANGAGDSFSAGVAYGLLAGASTAEVAAAGVALSSLTLSVDTTAHPALDRALLESTLERSRT